VSATEQFDLVVVGGGMAGMSAGAQAASQGARVLLCELADHLGGTAALSTGNVWTVQTPEAFRAADPDGDADLWQIVRDNLENSLKWLESVGVPVRERHRASSSSTYDPPPIGMNVDIETLMARGKRLIEAAGGWVLLGSSVDNLTADDGTVAGARVIHAKSGETMPVTCGAAVLATGGFQNSAELRARYLGKTVADAVRIRSNPLSSGLGLSLGLAAGAALSRRMDTFYGVLLPVVPGSISESDYRGLVLHSAVYGLVLGPDGRRIADESAGAVPLANQVARLGRALLVAGHRMFQESEDRLSIDLRAVIRDAGRRGARAISGATRDSAAAAAGTWGYDGDEVRSAIAAFDTSIAEGTDPTPARLRHRLPVGDDDIAVLEVQAAMTSTFGGLQTDANGQALRLDGAPVPGLFAAGVDQGGYNVSGYAGGLSRALVFGRRAAQTALQSR
jgi:succinate dehydrogenase/fumarate reductase flavoprotein subunit